MTAIQDANNRFNTLGEEIGAKRITIGDEDKGVEIVIDEDLSIFRLLDKLKDESEASHKKGDLSSADFKAVKLRTDAVKEALEGSKPDGLGDKFRKFLRK